MTGNTMQNGIISQTENEAQSWQHKILEKQQVQLQKIPSDWRLPDRTTTELLQLPLELHRNDVREIPRVCGIMSKRELSITEDYTVQKLLAALAASSLTALEVTTAFSKRAAIAGQVVSSTFWPFQMCLVCVGS